MLLLKPLRLLRLHLLPPLVGREFDPCCDNSPHHDDVLHPWMPLQFGVRGEAIQKGAWGWPPNSGRLRPHTDGAVCPLVVRPWAMAPS